jgi:hypothetical protein
MSMMSFNGPYDSSDFSAPTELVNFGSIGFVPNPQVTVRAEVEDGTSRIVAISFDYKESSLQIQAFASPKGIAIWGEVLEDIAVNLAGQGVTVRKENGPFGLEILADVPNQEGEIKTMRMFASDGDRWLLRGTIAGKTFEDLEVKTFLEDIFRGVVVFRGELPLPPREILPLELPSGAIVPKAGL